VQKVRRCAFLKVMNRYNAELDNLDLFMRRIMTRMLLKNH
jgi:hypothetical protein